MLKKSLFYLSYLTLATFILAEIFIRIFFPFDPFKETLDRSQEHPYIRTDWVPNFKRNYGVNGITAPSGVIKFEINPFGFRGRSMKTARKPEGTTRLFFLGGSTTECLLLSEEKTFAALVEEKLSRTFPKKRFESINQGISGYLAADSLVALIYKVLYYQPDTVFVMHGMNDMRYGFTPFYDPIHRRGYDKDLYRPGFQETLSNSLARLLKHSCFLTLFKWRIWNRLFPPEAERHKTLFDDLEEKRLKRRKTPQTALVPSKGQEELIQHLGEMIAIAKTHALRMILMTEPSIYTEDLRPEVEKQLWMGFIQESPPVNPPSPFLFLEMARFNNAVRELAAKEGIELIDLEKNIPKSTAYFYDDAHFTEKGAALAAEIISRYLIQNPVN